jgi:hypothetical protein
VTNHEGPQIHLRRIMERVSRLGDPNDMATPRPLLTIAEFFEGNNCIGSIGCNLSSTPAPKRFYEFFTQIAARADVKDIRVQVTVFDDPEWPFSETVYIMTSATLDEVASWFEDDIRPDEVSEGFRSGVEHEPYQIPMGTRPVLCWWD